MTDILEITPDGMDVVEIGYVSGGFIPVPGPKGDKGDKGDPGPSGTIAEQVIQFASAAPVWHAAHSLGRRPVVVCLDQNGFEIDGDVQPTSTTVDVTWAVPVAGTLLLY